MYDVHGKSFDGGRKGRMQQAVEQWEKSAARESNNLLEKSENSDLKTPFDDGNYEIITNDISNDKNDVEYSGIDEQLNKADEDDVKDIIKNNFKKISKERNSDINNEPVNDHNSSTKEFSSENDISKTRKTESRNSIEFNSAVKPDNIGVELSPDYDSEEQAQLSLDEQINLQSSITMRFAGTLLCTIALVFIATAPYFNITLPPIINAQIHPTVYLGVNLALLALAGIIGFPVAVGGITNLFKFKPDADSLTSLSFYAALAGNLYSFCCYAEKSAAGMKIPATAVFSSCAAAAIAFNLFGKIFLIARVKNNFKFIMDSELENGGFYSAKALEPNMARNILRGFKGTPSVAIVEKVRILTNFLEKSYTKTPSDRVSLVFAPIVLAAALVSAVVEFLLNYDVAGAVIVFCAICTVASPLLLEFGVSLPFYRSCKRLLKKKTLLTGYDALNEFGEIDAICMNADFLFPGSSTRIYGVKTFAKHDIEQVMLYAASIAIAGKSPIANALLNIFADVSSGKNLIKNAEKLKYEDEKGLSAIIDNKVILLGNRSLLRHHLIEVPSRDYELRYIASGKDVLYLAVDGEIFALIIVGYNLNKEYSTALHKLKFYNINLLLQSSDPNITPYLIEEKSEAAVKNVYMLGAREMQALSENETNGWSAAGLAFKDISGYVEGMISCLKLKGSLWVNTVIQTVFGAIGVLYVIYAVFFGGGALTVAPVYILAYQALCALPAALISIFRRV